MPKHKRFESQPTLSNSTPLIKANEAITAFVKPVEFFLLMAQSKIPGLEYKVKSRDQYVQKYLKQGRYNKIKSKEPEVIGLLSILNGEL